MMNRQWTRACVVAVALVLAQLHPFAQAGANPFLGSWTMDRAQSTFSGNTPDKRIMKFEQSPTGIKHTVETTISGINEGIFKQQYTFKVDGKDYPADPAMPVNVVSFKQVDTRTIERTGKYRGESIETVTFQLSADGKSMTVTQKGMMNGAEVSSVQLFTKE